LAFGPSRHQLALEDVGQPRRRIYPVLNLMLGNHFCSLDEWEKSRTLLVPTYVFGETCDQHGSGALLHIIKRVGRATRVTCAQGNSKKAKCSLPQLEQGSLTPKVGRIISYTIAKASSFDPIIPSLADRLPGPSDGEKTYIHGKIFANVGLPIRLMINTKSCGSSNDWLQHK
jgi:hypothetical protein